MRHGKVVNRSLGRADVRRTGARATNEADTGQMASFTRHRIKGVQAGAGLSVGIDCHAHDVAIQSAGRHYLHRHGASRGDARRHLKLDLVFAGLSRHAPGVDGGGSHSIDHNLDGRW